MVGLTKRHFKNMRKLKCGSDLKAGLEYEETVALNGILTLTRLNGVLGSDKQDRQNQKGILSLTSLNGLLGSD